MNYADLVSSASPRAGDRVTSFASKSTTRRSTIWCGSASGKSSEISKDRLLTPAPRLGLSISSPLSEAARIVSSSSTTMLNLIAILPSFAWRNVDVEREDVEWVVLILDGLQPCINCGWIAGTDVGAVAFAREVHIHFAFSVGCHRIACCPRPGNMWRQTWRLRRSGEAVGDK